MRTSFYTSSGSDVLIVSSSGDSVGYVEGRLIRTMVGAAPLIPVVGVLTPPIGYSLPSGQYAVSMNQFEDSVSSVLFSEGGRLYRYERLDADSGQLDQLNIGDGFSLKSNEPKVIRLKTIGGSPGEEAVFELLNLPIAAGDSVAVTHLSEEELRLANFGAAKEYDLRAQHLGSGIDFTFVHDDIWLSANTTHYLTAADTSLTVIQILVDLGNDGTIDDTMLVVNTVDVDEEDHSGIPGQYDLAQNYPNPFNPTTAISYQLSAVSYVTLRIYNILGQEVVTLVDELEEAGYWSAIWNATDVSSGVYFYRLDARGANGSGGFSSVRKMIVVK